MTRNPLKPVTIEGRLEAVSGVRYLFLSSLLQGGDHVFGADEITLRRAAEEIEGWRRVGYEPSYVFGPAVPARWTAVFKAAFEHPFARPFWNLNVTIEQHSAVEREAERYEAEFDKAMRERSAA